MLLLLLLLVQLQYYTTDAISTTAVTAISAKSSATASTATTTASATSCATYNTADSAPVYATITISRPTTLSTTASSTKKSNMRYRSVLSCFVQCHVSIAASQCSTQRTETMWPLVMVEPGQQPPCHILSVSNYTRKGRKQTGFGPLLHNEQSTGHLSAGKTACWDPMWLGWRGVRELLSDESL